MRSRYLDSVVAPDSPPSRVSRRRFPRGRATPLGKSGTIARAEVGQIWQLQHDIAFDRQLIVATARPGSNLLIDPGNVPFGSFELLAEREV